MGTRMKQALAFRIFSLVVFISVCLPYLCGGGTGFPEWINHLCSDITQAFHVQANTSSVKEPDPLEHNAYFSFSIQGHGSLERTPEPFEAMQKMFVARDWKPNERYQADGHGSSSLAYEKGPYFCLVSVAIDSSCDDEEGHVPSEYWFSVSCRERGNHPTGVRQ